MKVEGPSSWKIVKLVFSRKPDAEPNKKIRSYKAIALTSVMSKWHAACIIGVEKEEPESWKKIHVGRIEGISCQHSQVLMTMQQHRVAGGQKPIDEARQREMSHYVSGQYGHQDGLRCGKTEAHRENYGGS